LVQETTLTAKAFFDFRDKAQPFDGIRDCRLLGQGLERFNGPLLLSSFHVQNSTIVRVIVFACQPNA